MIEQTQPKEDMKPFEFPRNTLTYFYFLPDINDEITVEKTEGKRKYVYATIVIEGYMPLVDGKVSDQYEQATEFKPELARFTPTLWEKIQSVLSNCKDFADPAASVCVGIISQQSDSNRTTYTPFVATEQDSDVPLLTNLIERQGETTVLTAIAEATSLLPTTIDPTDQKRAGEQLDAHRTKLLHTLLDQANLLPLGQLEELVQIVHVTNNGRYKIKLRPRDLYLPHIGQTGDE